MTAPSQNAAQWLAIWLPRLATDRLKRSGAAPSDAPLAAYAKNANAFALTCVDVRAHHLGLSAGMALADAKAMQPALNVIEDDAAANARTLDAIGAWCERFTPVVVLDAPDGLFLNITGCAHLFGGEDAMRDGLVARLKTQGFVARAAIAPTPGAAWAFARYAPDPSPRGGGGDLLEKLLPLPVKALRLEAASVALLRRFGMKTVRQLYEAPRTPLSARAGERAMLRLDQALGRAPEALSPRRPPPSVYAARRFLEPIFTADAVLEVTQKLAADIIHKLEARGEGVRQAGLHLFGVDGRDRCLEIGVSRPEREVKALLRIFRERLNVAAEHFNAEFGFEAARLDVVQAERIEGVSQSLVAESDSASAEKIAAIVDVISARLGRERVLRPRFRDTHVPERAAAWGSALQAQAPSSHPPPPADGVMRRPLRLFQHPHLIEAMASVPDGPPLRFRWRRVLREVVRAEGPERIAGDWMKEAPARDYYRVEDKQGRRYWLYREGLYHETEAPRWFMQGLFA